MHQMNQGVFILIKKMVEEDEDGCLLGCCAM
jgi:hypothetical protein